MCIEGFCANEWCTCAGDSSIDDTGPHGGCIGFVACVQMCLYPPSGVDAGTVQQCAALCAPGYTQQQVQEGASLLSCVAANCATPTTCGQ
jgi:hypothetical protein